MRPTVVNLKSDNAWNGLGLRDSNFFKCWKLPTRVGHKCL